MNMKKLVGEEIRARLQRAIMVVKHREDSTIDSAADLRGLTRIRFALIRVNLRLNLNFDSDFIKIAFLIPACGDTT